MPTLTFTAFDVINIVEGWLSGPFGNVIPVDTVTEFGNINLLANEINPVTGSDCSGTYRQTGEVNFARLVNPLPPTAMINSVTVREPQSMSVDMTLDAIDVGWSAAIVQLSKLSIFHNSNPPTDPVDFIFSDSVSGIPSETVLYSGTPIDYANLVANYGTVLLQIAISDLTITSFPGNVISSSMLLNIGYTGGWEMEIVYDEDPFPITANIEAAPISERIPGNSIDITGTNLDLVEVVRITYNGEPTIDENGDLITPEITWIFTLGVLPELPAGFDPAIDPICNFIIHDTVITELDIYGGIPGIYFVDRTFELITDGLIRICITYDWWTWVPDREVCITLEGSFGELSLECITLPDVSGIYLITHSPFQSVSRHDALYDRATESTMDVKIADPLIRTGFVDN